MAKDSRTTRGGSARETWELGAPVSSGAKEEEAAKGEVSVAVSRRVMGVMALVRFWYRSVLPTGTKCLFFSSVFSLFGFQLIYIRIRFVFVFVYVYVFIFLYVCVFVYIRI